MRSLRPPRRTGDRRRLALPRLLWVALGALLATGCVRVQPHQRAIHSKRCMQADADPNGRAMQSHVHERREGSVGGTGVQGGGCGCN